MSPDRETVARSLRQARENRGMSQQEAAKHLGLSRSLVAQIELGNRAVSLDELATLAALYRRPVAEFTSSVDLQDQDALVDVVGLAPSLGVRGVRERLQDLFDLCRRAVDLEAALGRIPLPPAPRYEIGAPRTLAEAIAQGEHVAAQERQRLGFGTQSPVFDVANLVGSQGVRAATIDLPDDVLGIWVHRPSIGSVAIVSAATSSSARRMDFLAAYSHAVFGNRTTPVVATPFNLDELTQRRARAFAVAFLLPAAGIEAAIAKLWKGQPSRKTHTVFARGEAKPASAEIRAAPGSQTLAYHDLASLAQEFGTSYRSMAYRLEALGVLTDVESRKLRSAKHLRAAKDYVRLTASSPDARRDKPSPSPHSAELKRYIAHLAIEAYRRRLIDAETLAALAPKIMGGSSAQTRLLELAETAR